jgi:zinc protease
LLQEKLQDTAYDVHTYKHTTMGFEADIKTMPAAYDYSREFFRRFYRPENVVLIVAGDVDPKAAMTLIEKYYGKWKKGYVAPDVKMEPIHTKERTAEVSYPGRTLPLLVVAYQGDAYDPANRDYVAALLLDDLAFGESSPLFRKLVIEEQKVQFIGAHFPQNRNMPLFEIISMVKKADDLDYVKNEIYRTLEEFKEEPADAKKLAELKRRNKYAFLMQLDTPDHVAGALARLAALTGSIETVNEFYAAIDKVTPEDVQNAARRYFVPGRRTVVVLKGAAE